MKIFAYFTSLLIFSCFFSCKEQKTDTEYAVIQVNISEESSSLSTIVSEAKCISLETSKEAMIGNITKVIIKNDIIFILDDISRSVFKYDTDVIFYPN